MGDDLKWLVGAMFAVLAAVGGFISRDRYTMKTIRDGDDRLHKRITDLERDVVRKEEFARHIDRVDRNLEVLRTEVREGRQETTTRLDAVLAAVTSSSKR